MIAATYDAATFASGKGATDENFPVASRLVAPRHRAPIMAFYRFARAADDIADHPAATAAERLAALGAMADTLTGQSNAEPAARALRAVLAERSLSARHPLDLLVAFRRDVGQDRYQSWNELLGYCRHSAAPVGRFVLDVHGEDEALWSANDALCAALQIVNHLQDCAKDWRDLGRVYLPLDVLARHGASVEDLAQSAATPALRGAIAELAKQTLALLNEARPFARHIVDRRLGVEVAVIHALAASLARKLLHRDPLSQRVHHSRAEAAAIAIRAALGRLL